MEGGRIEIGRIMPVRSISKAQLTPSCLQFTTVSKPSPPPYPHFPTRDTTNTLLIILSLKKLRMDDSWQVFFDHNAWPGHSAGLEKSCHFACHSQVLTLCEFHLFFPRRSFSPYSQRLHCLKRNRQGFRPLQKEKPTAAALTRLSLSHSGGRTVLDIKIIPFP